MSRKYCYPDMYNSNSGGRSNGPGGGGGKMTQINATKLIYDRHYNDIEIALKHRLQCSASFVKRLDFEAELQGHNGCVNSLEWSESGRLLASGSDDYQVIIWDPFKRKRLATIETPHRGNIFSVKFLPKTNDSMVVTGAADYCLYVFDINRTEQPTWKCSCHTGRIKRLATTPSTPFLFWSSSEDGAVLQFDIRQPHTCNEGDAIQLLNLTNHCGRYSEIKCIAINPMRPELIAVGANDTFARVYDRRMITLQKLTPTATIECCENDSLSEDCVKYFTAGHFQTHIMNKEPILFSSHNTITYLTFNPNGTELLVNMGAEQIYLFDINNPMEPEYLNLPTMSNSGGTGVNNNNNNDDKIENDNVDNGDEDDVKRYNHGMRLARIEKLKSEGDQQFKAERYSQSIACYTNAIQLDENCAQLYLSRLTSYMKRNWCGDNYAAIRDCHSALRLDPKLSKAHFRLARALLDIGYLDDAYRCLNEFKLRFPQYINNNSFLMLQKDIAISYVHPIEERNDFSGLSPNETKWRLSAKDYKERFVGHCNTTTDIKEANYFGNDGQYIVAGSDDGNFFIWERPICNIVNIYRGDSAIVNCVQPHPSICMLATSGIDHDIRLWSPQPSENFESKHRVQNIDALINANQQRMNADPFDIHTSSGLCRTS